MSKTTFETGLRRHKLTLAIGITRVSEQEKSTLLWRVTFTSKDSIREFFKSKCFSLQFY